MVAIALLLAPEYKSGLNLSDFDSKASRNPKTSGKFIDAISQDQKIKRKILIRRAHSWVSVSRHYSIDTELGFYLLVHISPKIAWSQIAKTLFEILQKNPNNTQSAIITAKDFCEKNFNTPQNATLATQAINELERIKNSFGNDHKEITEKLDT